MAALFRPVRAVRRADHLPLWKAWGIHLAGTLLAWIVTLLLVAWSEAPDNASPVQVLGALFIILTDLVGELDQVAVWVAIIFTALGIELVWLVSAAVMMPWSAHDEPMRQSYRRALRRLCLITPHLATIIVLAGGMMIWIDRQSWDYSEWFSFGEIFQFFVFTAACLWSLWFVLAALGCLAPTAFCCWPARCEGCGYQLTGLQPDQDCPECGLAIERTLSHTTRPGIRGPGGIGWWLKQSYKAIRRPTEFGNSMHVLSPDAGHRRCLAFTLVLLMLASPIAMGALYMAIEAVESYVDRNNTFDWDQLIFISIVVGLWMGLLMTGILVAVALMGSGLAGILEGWRNGRNLMPAAIRGACYTSCFGLFWALVLWCNLMMFVIIMELDLLNPITRRYNLFPEDVALTWFGGVILIGLMIYLFLIGRVTKAARYANW